MSMNDIWPKMGTFAKREARGDLAKRREAEGIIRRIPPVRSHVGIARTHEKMRRIKYEKVKPGDVSAQHSGRSPKKFSPPAPLRRH